MAFGNTMLQLFQPLAAPAAAAPGGQLQPASRSKLLADILATPPPPTPHSWGEGLVNALNTGFSGYLDSRALRQGELDKKQKANALADALFGKGDPNSPNVADPRHDQVATMLANGTLDPSALAPIVASKLGLSAPDYQYVTDNGTIVRVNKTTGQADPIYAGSPNDTSAITEFKFAQKQGYGGTFEDYQKQYGTNRAAEDWSLTPQLMTDGQSNVVGAMRFSNRGGIQWMDGQGNVTKTFHPGDPGYSQAAATAQASGAPLPAAPATAPVAAPTPSDVQQMPAPNTTQPAVNGTLRGPGSVKIVNQGTQSTIIGPTGAPQQTLPTYNTQETADKAAGTAQAGDLQTVNNASIKATTQKNSIALMRQAASAPNFYSGALSDQVLAARKLGVALGMDPSLAANMENFQSMSNQLVKDRLGSLGTGVSNADVGFISRTVPTLEATSQGNQQLLDILERLADRDIAVGTLAQQYAKDRGGGTRLDANWPTYLAQWAADNPLFAPANGGPGGPGGQSPGQPSIDDLIKKYAP